MITALNIHLMRGGRTLLHDANFSVYPSEKVAIIGRNGSGKSSLFAALLKEFELDAGSLTFPDNWRVATVKQHVDTLERSVLDYIIDGHRLFRELNTALTQAQANDDGHRIATLYAHLDDIDAYSIESKAAILANGLGFKPEDLHKPLSDFSGGWQNRANLAQALMQPSELLLLDEPTNHLDLDAVFWLENWLKQYSGAVLLISHDRDFIDSVAQKTLYFDQQKIETYTGNFSQSETLRALKQQQQESERIKQEQKKAHLTRFIERFGAKASKAKQAQSRLKTLGKMIEIEALREQAPFSFQFPNPENPPSPLLQLSNTQIGYGKPLLNNVNFELYPSARIGLLGHNGAGKTTLMRSLAQQLPLLAGDYTASSKLKIGYFTQQQIETLDPDASSITHLSRLTPDISTQKKRDFLGGFGFCGDRALCEIAPFSGGEKARLALALLVWQAPNVLLLDEPTNHLDMDMRDALTYALLQFDGAMVIISHDRHILRATCDTFFLVDQGQVAVFEGDLDDYGIWAQKQQCNANAQNKPTQHTPAQPTDHYKRQKQNESLRRKLQSNLTKEEQKQIHLQEELDRIEVELNQSELYEQSQNQKLQALLQQQKALQEKLKTSEEQWFDYQTQMDALKNPQ